MNEDEKHETEDDDLTPEGRGTEGDTGASGEEADRTGELDDLRDRLERIESALDGIASTLEAMRTTAAAIDIDNGADVVGADGDGDADAGSDDDDAYIVPDYDDMDLDL